jgi:hypothetical protein
LKPIRIGGLSGILELTGTERERFREIYNWSSLLSIATISVTSIFSNGVQNHNINPKPVLNHRECTYKIRKQSQDTKYSPLSCCSCLLIHPGQRDHENISYSLIQGNWKLQPAKKPIQATSTQFSINTTATEFLFKKTKTKNKN